MEEAYSSEQQNNRRSRRSVHQPDKNLELQKPTKKKTKSIFLKEKLKYCKLIEVAYHEMQIQLDITCDIHMLRDWMKALVELNIDLEIDSSNDKHIIMVKQLIEQHRTPTMNNLTQFTTENVVNSETDSMDSEITSRKQSMRIKTYTPVGIKNDSHTESHLSISKKPEEVTGNKLKRTYQCDKCFKQYTNLHNLKYHIRLRDSDKVLNCNQCKKIFCRNIDLQRHIGAFHAKCKFECPICLKTYASAYRLREHRLTNHDGYRYECGLCPKSYTQMGAVTSHRNSVHGGVQYQCDECKHIFNRKGSFDRHIIVVHSTNSTSI
ncbi:hypothetical protein BLOT_016107 [Blomia tropicalis]|nr:hypothetical protein BLOT_016107 [Blomia tropicalis]